MGENSLCAASVGPLGYGIGSSVLKPCAPPPAYNIRHLVGGIYTKPPTSFPLMMSVLEPRQIPIYLSVMRNTTSLNDNGNDSIICFCPSGDRGDRSGQLDRGHLYSINAQIYRKDIWVSKWQKGQGVGKPGRPINVATSPHPTMPLCPLQLKGPRCRPTRQS